MLEIFIIEKFCDEKQFDPVEVNEVRNLLKDSSKMNCQHHLSYC